MKKSFEMARNFMLAEMWLSTQRKGHKVCNPTEGKKWKRGGYEECDLVIVSGGWSPVLHLLSHKGVKPVWNEKNACFIAGDHSEPITMAGSAAGIWDHEDCVRSGEANGFCTAEMLGKKVIKYSFPNSSGVIPVL